MHTDLQPLPLWSPFGSQHLHPFQAVRLPVVPRLWEARHAVLLSYFFIGDRSAHTSTPPAHPRARQARTNARLDPRQAAAPALDVEPSQGLLGAMAGLPVARPEEFQAPRGRHTDGVHSLREPLLLDRRAARQGIGRALGDADGGAVGARGVAGAGGASPPPLPPAPPPPPPSPPPP